MERTFVMVKPDGVRRGLVGEIIRRFEARGLRIGTGALDLRIERRGNRVQVIELDASGVSARMRSANQAQSTSL